MASFGEGAFQLFNLKIVFGGNFAYLRKLFILLIEQLSALRGNGIKQLRAFYCFARGLRFPFQLGNSAFEFFDPLCPFLRSLGQNAVHGFQFLVSTAERQPHKLAP